MPITQSTIIFDLVLFVKIAILIILLLYVIFSLIIARQVDLMVKTLITPVSPIIKAISIVNIGFAIGFFVLAIGIL